jgi:CSLREA domain-containing protein/MYXO-CTERM domain-containing protein
MLLRCPWIASSLSLSLFLSLPAAGAVFTVTKTSDGNDGLCDADCSLREAVQAANLVPGSTVLVPAGHYRLTRPPPDRTLNNPGDGSGGNLLVNAPMTITGAGRDRTIIDARPPGAPQGVDRVLAVYVNGDLSLSGVTLTGGTLLAESGGFGIDQGAGIQVLGGRLRIADSAVVENFTKAAGGGLVIANNGPTPAVVEIARTTIADNRSLGAGGGIFAINGTVTITDSTIRGNRSVRGGGGGVMNMNTGSRQITPMALLRVLRSTIADNVSGDPEIDPLAGGSGGGIYNSSGRLEVENSTITGNEATGFFLEGLGFVPDTGRGGGVASWAQLGDEAEDTAVIVNSTIAWNAAPSGSQLHVQTQNGNLFELANTLVAGDGSFPNCRGQGGQAGFLSLGGNVSSDASPCQLAQAGDRAAVAPGLAAALADNGGPTETLALQGGSPALGLGVPASCPQRDQRGALRRVPCDSGAVEAVPVPEAGAAAAGLAALGALAALRRRRARA